MGTYIVHAEHRLYPYEFGTMTYFFCDLDEARERKKEIEMDTDGEFDVRLYKATLID